MEVKVFGTKENTENLLQKAKHALEELGLSDFIKLEQTTDKELKKELDIKKEPALIIEEKDIDFKDVIFEGITPEEEELKSMFISIIGGGESEGGCAPGGCGSGCSC